MEFLCLFAPSFPFQHSHFAHYTFAALKAGFLGDSWSVQGWWVTYRLSIDPVWFPFCPHVRYRQQNNAKPMHIPSGSGTKYPTRFSLLKTNIYEWGAYRLLLISYRAWLIYDLENWTSSHRFFFLCSFISENILQEFCTWWHPGVKVKAPRNFQLPSLQPLNQWQLAELTFSLGTVVLEHVVSNSRHVQKWSLCLCISLDIQMRYISNEVM